MKQGHVTPNLPTGEDSNNQPEGVLRLIPSCRLYVRYTLDSTCHPPYLQGWATQSQTPSPACTVIHDRARMSAAGTLHPHYLGHLLGAISSSDTQLL
ncbi:hypothetical protein FRC08_014597 [Ceratobasidium sp. 394]|nr:hypothetical protein FRC08_014597 [Ceratobasidium sp. 394]